MVAAIVTFADSRMSHMHRRFKRQVRNFGLFDRAYIWTERDLNEEFRREYGGLLNSGTRGFGYWVWKPQVILQALELLKEGDTLVYLDSGSHLNPLGRKRFSEYVLKAETSETGILAFQLDFVEKDWTKGDLLDFYLVRENSDVVDSGQIQAGALVIQKRKTTSLFIRKWLRPFSVDVGLVDDSPSLAPNDPGFRAHRHDQSIFSIIAKQEKVATLSANEQFPYAESMTWDNLNSTPFHHRRDKSTFFTKIRKRVYAHFMPLKVCSVKIKALALRLRRRLSAPPYSDDEDSGLSA
jgi:hypothetical protein